jgi:hypothetical protein
MAWIFPILPTLNPANKQPESAVPRSRLPIVLTTFIVTLRWATDDTNGLHLVEHFAAVARRHGIGTMSDGAGHIRHPN